MQVGRTEGWWEGLLRILALETKIIKEGGSRGLWGKMMGLVLGNEFDILTWDPKNIWVWSEMSVLELCTRDPEVAIVTMGLGESRQNDKGQSWEEGAGVRCSGTPVWLGLPSLDNCSLCVQLSFSLFSLSPNCSFETFWTSLQAGPAERYVLHQGFLHFLPFFFSLVDAHPLLQNIMVLSGLFVHMANSDLLEEEVYLYISL